MIKQQSIELLVPARNLECGMVVINYGTDAVVTLHASKQAGTRTDDS